MYRIAHISDLHISKISLNPIHLFTKRWIGIINLLFSRKKHYASETQLYELIDLFEKLKINLVIVSGDLSSTALESEFSLARNLFDKIEEKGIKTLFIPGNHDLYTKKSFRKKSFYQYFENKKEKKSYPHKELTLKKDGLEVHPLFENWWFLGIDTAISTSLISSRGLFSKELEEKLDKLLSHFPKNAKVILVTHFPFFETESPRKKMMRAKKLHGLLKRHPHIKFYLHGHTHKHTIADLRKSKLPIVLDSGSSGHNRIGRWNFLEFSKDQCKLDVFEWKKQKHHIAPQWNKTKEVTFFDL